MEILTCWSTNNVLDAKIPFEDLQFEDVIGKGAFATVYKGSWKGRVVALKTLKLPPDTEVHNLASNNEIVALQ